MVDDVVWCGRWNGVVWVLSGLDLVKDLEVNLGYELVICHDIGLGNDLDLHCDFGLSHDFHVNPDHDLNLHILRIVSKKRRHLIQLSV